jgi:phosphoribosylpyrophosphate synthetase
VRFVNESGAYSAVFRHSFRKKVIEDGKEIRRNVIDDEIVVAAPDAGSFTRAKFPQLADAKELKQSGFFARLRFLLKQLLTVKRGRGMMAAWY